MTMTGIVAQHVMATGQIIEAAKGDLTQEALDAIVNAANSRLAHGGGVAGAIVRRGGLEIQRESDRYVQTHGEVPTGNAILTGAGQLAAKYVIHAVGPIWHGGVQNEEQLLRAAAWNSFLTAHEHGLSSLAMPAISSGIFGFPKPRCAEILVGAARDFFLEHPGSTLKQVRFTNIDDESVDLFAKQVRGLER